MTPARVLGVDFSGARDAGRKIFVAFARPARGALFVHEVVRLSDAGGRERAAAYRVLRGLLAVPGTVAGLDFPFSIPAAAMRRLGARSWRALAAAFARQGSPDAVARAAGDWKAWRPADLAARAPLPPLDLRLRAQTVHGIAEILAPLAAGGAAVVPFTRSRDGPWLIEACPACYLRAHGAPAARLYKTTDATPRRAIVRWLAARGVELAPAARRLAISDAGGDALDAAICAAAADDAWRAGEIERPARGAERLEGRIAGLSPTPSRGSRRSTRGGRARGRPRSSARS